MRKLITLLALAAAATPGWAGQPSIPADATRAPAAANCLNDHLPPGLRLTVAEASTRQPAGVADDGCRGIATSDHGHRCEK